MLAHEVLLWEVRAENFQMLQNGGKDDWGPAPMEVDNYYGNKGTGEKGKGKGKGKKGWHP